jgi:hypothetical protein
MLNRLTLTGFGLALLAALTPFVWHRFSPDAHYTNSEIYMLKRTAADQLPTRAAFTTMTRAAPRHATSLTKRHAQVRDVAAAVAMGAVIQTAATEDVITNDS